MQRKKAREKKLQNVNHNHLNCEIESTEIKKNQNHLSF